MPPRRTSLVIAAAVLVWLSFPADALAQRYHHGPARTHVSVGVGWGWGYPYYAPYYWYPFYSPFWGPYYWPPMYGYGYWSGYGYASEVRVMATPREAEVYVDGYLVGTVDDFDGWSQRLRLDPGEHEVELYLEGYRSVRQKMLFRPSETYKIRVALEKADPSEPPATRPRPDPAAAAAAAALRELRPSGVQQSEREPPRRTEASGFGTLAIRVQPADAVILVDGERWERPEGDPRFTLELAPGRHDVEVRLDGHRTYRTTVEIRPGETTPINVSLPVN